MVNAVDEDKLNEFAGKVMGDIAGAMGVFMAYIGDQAGVYRMLANTGRVTHEEFASKANLQRQYAREWLNANAALGYVNYCPEDEHYWMTPEQTLIMAQEGHPACMQGFLQSVVSQFETNATAVETFTSGVGRPWGDHSACLFCGVDRFFRPGYEANLIENWVPAIKGMNEKLKSGGKIADVGCGHGSSTVLLAKAFPKAQILGVDIHAPSIQIAEAKTKDAGLENVKFQNASATEFKGGDFDLVCIFDALHDMGDPIGAAQHIRSTLKQDGSFMVVEPLAGDTLAENMHPLGAIFYSFSTTVCTPCSLSQPGAMGLGTQAGEKKLTEVLNKAGFSKVKRVAETAANMVLDARI